MTSVLLKCRIEAFLFLSKWNKCIIIQNVRFCRMAKLIKSRPILTEVSLFC